MLSGALPSHAAHSASRSFASIRGHSLAPDPLPTRVLARARALSPSLARGHPLVLGGRVDPVDPNHGGAADGRDALQQR